MDSSGMVLEEMEFINSLATWLAWILGVVIIALGVWTIASGFRTQSIVDRARSTQGIDLLANVVDKPLYFQFLRKQRVMKGLSLLLLAVAYGLFVSIFIGRANSSLENLKEPRHLSPEQVSQLKAKRDQLEDAHAELQSALDEAQEALQREDPNTEEIVTKIQEELGEFLHEVKR